MAKHLELGRQGEQLAVDYLIQKGYRIEARNYRAGRGELDIIAWASEQLLVFVEVKTRTDDLSGGPEQAITQQKQRLLARVAGAYMEAIGYDWEVRFDTIAIVVKNGLLVELRHVEDAFFI